jgi:phospholipid/cholesterol/gamma-HCH transport system substrate-binding protein
MKFLFRYRRALRNGSFVLVVLAIAVGGMVQVARRHWDWQETFHARAEFANIAGVEPGGAVRLQGINAGVVEAIVPPSTPGKPVTLILRLDKELHSLIRSDAVARISTLGVVGAKVVDITPGKPDAPPLTENGILTAESPLELSDLLKDASTSLKRLDQVAMEAQTGLGEINAIAASIRKGEGSLGKLVRDDEAYNKLIALSGRGERTLTDIGENLAALKRTWPISGYFKDRAFFDRDLVLYQPGAQRDEKTLADDDLFEPGLAILTPKGRAKLDKVADWFKGLGRPKRTEVVIAAFTDDNSQGEQLAQELTQKQAEAVRKYLVEQHSVDWNGFWSGRRRVAAVGFGTRSPARAGEQEHAPSGPPRRVEIILFTPQA